MYFLSSGVTGLCVLLVDFSVKAGRTILPLFVFLHFVFAASSSQGRDWEEQSKSCKFNNSFFCKFTVSRPTKEIWDHLLVQTCLCPETPIYKPYRISHIGMCRPEGYHFRASPVWNRVQNSPFCSKIGYIFRCLVWGTIFSVTFRREIAKQKRNRHILFGASQCPVRCHCEF